MAIMSINLTIIVRDVRRIFQAGTCSWNHSDLFPEREICSVAWNMYSTTKICAHVFNVLSTHESDGRSACIWSCSGWLPWLLNCYQRFPKGSRAELVLEGALTLFLPAHTLFDTTGSRILTITGFLVRNNNDFRPLFIVSLFSCVSVACFACCLIVWLMLSFFFLLTFQK